MAELGPSLLLSVKVPLGPGRARRNALFNLLGKRWHKTQKGGHGRLHQFQIAIFHD